MSDEGKSFYLIRHGTTELNEGSRNSVDTIRGWIDIPLDEEGKAEAKKLAQEFSNVGLVTVYSSDLDRAAQTAKAIAQAADARLLTTMGLRPWNLGKFAGKTTVNVLPEIAKYATEIPSTPVPKGESFNAFKARTFKTLTQILDHGKDDIIAVVTHHRVERLIKAWLAAGAKPDQSIDLKTFLQKGEAPGHSEVITIDTPISVKRSAVDIRK